MFDLSGIGIIIIFVLLIVLALAIAIKLLSTGEELIEAQQVNATPVPMDEGKFLTAFLRPVYDDGLDELETAVDAIRDGLDYYGRGAYVDAGEQFIAAGRGLDAAGRKFREVLALVEDQGEEYAKSSRSRLADCKRFTELARDMENACDAMLDDRAAGASAIADRMTHLKKLAEEWKKE